jgi:hypothetical protein
LLATICATADRNRVASGNNLRRYSHVLRCRRRAQAGVVAVPQRHIVSHHHAAHRIHQVFGLQIGELLLLVAQFDVEKIVVDLRNDRLQRHAPLHARRAHHRRHDAARVDEAGRPWTRNRRLLKEPRRMTGRRNLLDALPEGAGTPADVEDLGLIQRNFDSARPNKISCRVNVCKGCVHRLFPPPPWGQSLVS